MQCLTGLTLLLLIALESILKNQHSSQQYCTYWHRFKSDYVAVKFLPPYRIKHLSIPCCWRWWYHPIMNVFWFVIWTTLLYKSYSMLRRLLRMWAQSVQLVGRILDMHHHGGSICIEALRRPADVASYVLFVIKFFAIHRNIGPAQWATTCWHNRTSRSWTNQQSRNLLNCLVGWSMKQHWSFWTEREVEGLHW